jgi:hypothetical protein
LTVPGVCRAVALLYVEQVQRVRGGFVGSQFNICCLGLVVLTLGRDQPPLRGPRPLKPPALPEDTYWRAEPRTIYVVAMLHETNVPSF